jgi:hypothetical protein
LELFIDLAATDAQEVLISASHRMVVEPMEFCARMALMPGRIRIECGKASHRS